MSLNSDPAFPFLKTLDIPQDWKAGGQRFLEEGGLTLVLGGPGTGKSTLCQYLVYKAYVAGKPVGLLDLDLGQSHLGPPGALGLGFFPPRFPGEHGLFPERLYFIGQTSPVGKVLEVVVGSRILVDEARALGVERLVVNTSGLIQGHTARRLKQAEVALLRPNLLLALARDRELTPLLRSLGQGIKTLDLSVSYRAVLRSPDERRQYREARFRRYFDKAQRLDLPLSEVLWHGFPLGGGEPLSPENLDRWSKILGEQVLYGADQDNYTVLLLNHPMPLLPSSASQERLRLLSRSDLEHHLVGLWDKSHRTLALGLLLPSSWQKGFLQVWAPLPASQISHVSFVSLGRLKLSLTGRELALSS